MQTVDPPGHKTAGAWHRPPTTCSAELRIEYNYALVILLCDTRRVTGRDMIVPY